MKYILITLLVTSLGACAQAQTSMDGVYAFDLQHFMSNYDHGLVQPFVFTAKMTPDQRELIESANPRLVLVSNMVYLALSNDDTQYAVDWRAKIIRRENDFLVVERQRGSHSTRSALLVESNNTVYLWQSMRFFKTTNAVPDVRQFKFTWCIDQELSSPRILAGRRKGGAKE